MENTPNQIKLNKKQTTLLNNYNNAKYDNLHQVYATCSNAKIYAWQNIIDEMHKNGGYNIRITGYNCMAYSCAYKYQIFNDNEIITKLVYHTKSNKFEFVIKVEQRKIA